MNIWMVTRVDGKMTRQATVEADDLDAALAQLVEAMDCPRPVVLNKHRREWEDFGKTAFRPADFIEPVDFEKLEVDSLRTPSKSADPRNATDPAFGGWQG